MPGLNSAGPGAEGKDPNESPQQDGASPLPPGGGSGGRSDFGQMSGGFPPNFMPPGMSRPTMPTMPAMPDMGCEYLRGLEIRDRVGSNHIN